MIKSHISEKLVGVAGIGVWGVIMVVLTLFVHKNWVPLIPLLDEPLILHTDLMNKLGVPHWTKQGCPLLDEIGQNMKTFIFQIEL